jgi:putative addiction module component (TIGR02574 family)
MRPILRSSILTKNPESVVLTAAQREEIQTRLEAHDKDPSTALSWDQVRFDLFPLGY